MTVPQLSPNLIGVVVLFGTFLGAAITIRKLNENLQKTLDDTLVSVSKYLPQDESLNIHALKKSFGPIYEVIVKQDRMRAELKFSGRLFLLAPFFSFVPVTIAFLDEQAIVIVAGVFYLLSAILVIAAYALNSIANSTLENLVKDNPAILRRS